MASMEVYIKTPDIKTILPRSTSVYWFKNTNLDSVQITTSGKSLVILDTCNINMLDIGAQDETSVKGIGCDIKGLNYNLQENSIAEFSKIPDSIDGNISDEAFFKTRNECILSPEKELKYQQVKLDLFPGFPIAENLDKLTSYMEERFQTTSSEVIKISRSNRNRFFSCFITHIGRTTMISPIKSFMGGKLMGQDVYRWDLAYIKGRITNIAVFFPENTNQQAIINRLESIYGEPDQVNAFKDSYSTTWENESTGIDSSMKVYYKKGLNGTCQLAFQFIQDGGIPLLRDEWEVNNYDWIWSSITRKILEGMFLNYKIEVANQRLKSIPWFLFLRLN